LQEAVHQDPQDFGACFLLGFCQFGLGQDVEALACYTTCIALWPHSSWAHFNRGVMYLRQGEYQQAGADFDQVIRLRPDLNEAYLNRALAWQGLHKYHEAVADLTCAMKLGTFHTRAYFMRARAKELLGDREGADGDIAEGLRLEPSGEKDWIARGVARLSKDPEAALADFSAALECNDRSRAALQNLAHVLAERLGRTREAVAVLDKAVTHYPDYVPARAGRGVLLARLKQGAAAHRDAEEALSRDYTAPTLYQVASIYALTSSQYPEDRSEALRLLSSALRKGYGLPVLDNDKDWDALRKDPEFRRLVEAARALRPDDEGRSTKRGSCNGTTSNPEEKDSQQEEHTDSLNSSVADGREDGKS
jgi:eukaryotic-like serine/threonine-protein kinase